jgi:hypothetical protein
MNRDYPIFRSCVIHKFRYLPTATTISKTFLRPSIDSRGSLCIGGSILDRLEEGHVLYHRQGGKPAVLFLGFLSVVSFLSVELERSPMT